MIYNVLALDGGGIRGLFTAKVLARLVEEDPYFIHNIDLFAGTSTGGILALGLAAGKSPSDIVDMYLHNVNIIFEDSIWDDLMDLGGAVGADYASEGIASVLDKVFGDMILGDLTKKVLIPTFLLNSGGREAEWKPKFFNNYLGSDTEERVVDVAMRTSAAPTYFPTYQGYVDGGTVANNPSMAAIATCLDRKGAGVDLDEIKVLSISTGKTLKKLDNDSNDWGWSQWARPLIDILISGVSGVSDFQCRQLLGDRYFRLDPVLSRDLGIDSKSGEDLAHLLYEAELVDLQPLLDWAAKE
jgi:patatin-like phospholipase/acyl hydrolase